MGSFFGYLLSLNNPPPSTKNFPLNEGGVIKSGPKIIFDFKPSQRFDRKSTVFFYAPGREIHARLFLAKSHARRGVSFLKCDFEKKRSSAFEHIGGTSQNMAYAIFNTQLQSVKLIKQTSSNTFG